MSRRGAWWRRSGLRYWWPLLVLAIGLAGFVVLGISIGRGVGQIATVARGEFDGDEVDALMQLVESDRHTLRERNRAVWALGQIGDARARPLLERLYTGEECQHDKFLCQHELKKALDLCRGAPNLSAWVWRGGRARQR